MTQQSPLSANPGHQPGQMTAVMRAVASTGPKVLRIGLIQEGRVVEERIIKQRTDVTVGPSEKNMFVIPAGDLPSSFSLFELKGKTYHLNFTDGMKGRLALQTGLSDLDVIRGQASRNSQGGHQVPLTDDSRGKVVIGDTTLLFQFVAPPPIQPRPQLPVSVTRGAASVDWPTTVIAAFSFLLHFCAIGAIYSDWLDPVIDYDVNVSALVETVRALPAPPPVEEPKEEAPAEEKAEAQAPRPDPKPQPSQAEPEPKEGVKEHLNKEQVAALSNELESLEMATLAALAGDGPATANVLRSGEVPTSALDAAAASEAGVSSAGPGGLKLGAAGGAIRPGAAGGGLASIGSSSKSGGTGSGQTAKVKGPRGSASVGGTSVAGGQIGNASRAVAQMRAGFRACYNRGLQSNPDIEGKIQLSIKVGPGGQVLGVTAKKKGNIPDGVLDCVKARAQSGRFDPPQGGAAVVQVPVSFVRQ
jgi:outer membrane biosynthesis protein TonB